MKLRYTVSLAAIVLVVAAVIVGRALPHGHPPGRTQVQPATDDGAATVPLTTAPSTRPGAANPTSIATSFARTWIRGTTMAAPDWRRALAKYSTGTLARQFDGVDPSTVPAHTLTGVPTVTSPTRDYVTVNLPTDTGTLILGVRATAGEWHVDTVDWIPA